MGLTRLCARTHSVPVTRGLPLTRRPAALQTTFFRAWPKNKGSFLMYGRSVHTQRREAAESLLKVEPMAAPAENGASARPLALSTGAKPDCGSGCDFTYTLVLPIRA